MIKNNIIKFREVMEAIGINTFHLQGDNSNFYSDGKGVDGNAIIFDDTNELAWGIRVNDNFPNSRYRITGFDYDMIQYLTMEATPEQVKQFLEIIKSDVTDLDVEEVAAKFKRSKYDKGFVYKNK